MPAPILGLQQLGTTRTNAEKLYLFQRHYQPNSKVSIEDAVWRSEKFFQAGHFNVEFWEGENLKKTNKNQLLDWIKGVHLKEFLSSFTVSKFKGINIYSYYPQQTQLPNYVSPEFEPFIDTTIEEWINTGVLARWEEIKNKNNSNDKPTTVMLLGEEPSKPKAICDGRFVDEHCEIYTLLWAV